MVNLRAIQGVYPYRPSDLQLMENFQSSIKVNFQFKHTELINFFNHLKKKSVVSLMVKCRFVCIQNYYGSNLDPESAVDASGNRLSLNQDIYPNYDIILATTDYSLTAPLTAKAKEYGFRGATLHGLNRYLNSGYQLITMNQ